MIKGGRISDIYKSLKAEMSDEEKAKRDKEYKALLAMFIALLKNLDGDVSREEALEELAKLRTQIAMSYVFEGMKIDNDRALQLLKNLDDNNLTKHDIDMRDRLVAAVENLSEFSTAGEYQLMKKAIMLQESGYGIDFNDDEAMEEYYELCELYNSTYATVENNDVEFAASIALWWIGIAENTWLTYMTQNDDRVRPWHFALQGFTDRKINFPDWMIPPIEWGCRCFLESNDGWIYAKGNDMKNVQARVPKKPKELNGIFDESLAKCGRIFGKKHPYFKVEKGDVDMLKRIVKNIKDSYYAGN